MSSDQPMPTLPGGRRPLTAPDHATIVSQAWAEEETYPEPMDES